MNFDVASNEVAITGALLIQLCCDGLNLRVSVLVNDGGSFNRMLFELVVESDVVPW